MLSCGKSGQSARWAAKWSAFSALPYNGGMASNNSSSPGSTYRRALVLALAVFGLLADGIFIWYRLTLPSTSAHIRPDTYDWLPDGVIVTPINAPPSGLQTGDLVIAANGRTLADWAEPLLQPNVPRPAFQEGDVIEFTVVRQGQTRIVREPLRRYPLAGVLAPHGGTLAFVLAFQVIATYVLVRRPRGDAAQVLFVIGWSFCHYVIWSQGLRVDDLISGVGFWLYRLPTLLLYLLTFSASLHFALVFPKPRSWLHRRLYVVALLYIAPYILFALYMAALRPLSKNALDWVGRWSAGEWLIAALFTVLTLFVSIQAYQLNRDPVSRLQMRWVLFGTLASLGALLTFALVPRALLGYPLMPAPANALLILPIPLSLAAGILRNRLFDIELIINRTLVYGALITIIVSVSTILVGGVGALLHPIRSVHEGHEFALSILMAAIVAVLFQPVRERLQQVVNRLMYGERDAPYTVLSRLDQRLEATLAPGAVLPTIIETVSQALKLPYAAVELLKDGEVQTSISFGSASDEVYRFPLLYQSVTVGQLVVAPRAPGETLSPLDHRLLEDIAHHAGVAVHAVQLTADLQRSRERLVRAREEERRRLRRDLHDGLGPTLAAMSMKIDAARNQLARNPAVADELLAELKGQMQAAIADIRQVVYALRPPSLDELGLISALQEHAAQYGQADGLQIEIQAHGELPALPAAVEVAAYRIALEALTNVVRHAHACCCSIRLSLADQQLELEIGDDGVGLADDAHRGVGLTSMQERAAELGGTCQVETRPSGGTRVVARLPLPAMENEL